MRNELLAVGSQRPSQLRQREGREGRHLVDVNVERLQFLVGPVNDNRPLEIVIGVILFESHADEVAHGAHALNVVAVN